jgi:hypothetical protein
MSQNRPFPQFPDEQNVVCFNCNLPVTGPFQASGHADGNGAMRGQCTGAQVHGVKHSGCGRITYFDFVRPVAETPVK